ncbi:hypothetical protein Bca4012_026092 [Brassica carinata]
MESRANPPVSSYSKTNASSVTAKPHGKSTASSAILKKPNGKTAVSSAIPKKTNTATALSSPHGDSLLYSDCPVLIDEFIGHMYRF